MPRLPDCASAMDDISHTTENPLNFYSVSATDSPDFSFLMWALTHSSIIALDCEWKPTPRPDKEKQPQHQYQKRRQRQRPTQKQKREVPTVSLLQIACQPRPGLVESVQFDDTVSMSKLDSDKPFVFLLDLQLLPLASIYEPLLEMFVSSNVLKLGFDFYQDLRNLSSTFCSQGCDPGFIRVEPYIDIWSMYDHWQRMQPGGKISQQRKGLAVICKEILGVHLPKELQCSDWSYRPLTEEQKTYAAADVDMLLKIFAVFHAEADGGGSICKGFSEKGMASTSISKDEPSEASDTGQALPNVGSTESAFSAELLVSDPFGRTSIHKDDCLLKIIQNHGSELSLEKKIFSTCKGSDLDANRSLRWDCHWKGPEPWDLTLGGDGCPRFLCEVMVICVAEFLRGIGIDTAVASCKAPDCRELLDQAGREKRVLLTMRKKFPKHEYLKKNQICVLRSNKKDKQIKQVIETFRLTKVGNTQLLPVDQLISRYTKVKREFISEPFITGTDFEQHNGELGEKPSKQPNEYEDNLSTNGIISQIEGQDDNVHACGDAFGVASSGTSYKNSDVDASSAFDTKFKEMEEKFQQLLIDIEQKHAAEIELLRSEMRAEFEKKDKQINILKKNLDSMMAHTTQQGRIFVQNPMTSEVQKLQICRSSFANATQPCAQRMPTFLPSVNNQMQQKHEHQNPFSTSFQDYRQNMPFKAHIPSATLSPSDGVTSRVNVGKLGFGTNRDKR